MESGIAGTGPTPVAIVTGASGGIGAATAIALAARGYRVVLAARTGERLREVEERIRQAGGEAVSVAGDMSRTADIDRAFAAAADLGPLDLLVNNAGRGIYDPVEQGRPEDWQTMIDLNLFGLLYASQQAVRVMRPRQAGTIVNVSSVGGRKGIPGWAVYNATKFGVVGFSEALRLEVLRDGIRVVVIEPGAVETAWGENMPESFRQLRGQVPPLTAEDIAAAIVYAVSQPPHVAVNELPIRPTGQER